MGEPQPYQGFQIVPPRVPPQAGDRVTHYEIIEPQPGCCQCEGMKSEGIIAIILLLFFFPILAFIPCLMPECFERRQRPVYGPGGGGGPYYPPPQAPVTGHPQGGHYGGKQQPPPQGYNPQGYNQPPPPGYQQQPPVEKPPQSFHQPPPGKA